MSAGYKLIKRHGQLRIYLSEEKDYELKFKLSLLNLIIELQDVEKASKIMKIPASTAYRWINYWNDDGKEGIKNGQCPELDRIIYIV